MALLVPALNAYTEQEFIDRARVLRAVRPPWAQIDVSDGILGTPKNFASPELAARELKGIKLEAHLMAQDVLPIVAQWKKIALARITVHIEALPDPHPTFAGLRTAGIECGLALSPFTDVNRAGPFLPEIDLLLLVGVAPGRSGQAMDAATSGRVRAVRQQAPTLNIGVDGGVTAAVIPDLLSAGATTICVASAIFRAPDPRKAYRELRQLVEQRPSATSS